MPEGHRQEERDRDETGETVTSAWMKPDCRGISGSNGDQACGPGKGGEALARSAPCGTVRQPAPPAAAGAAGPSWRLRGGCLLLWVLGSGRPPASPCIL